VISIFDPALVMDVQVASDGKQGTFPFAVNR
jgi:hypothetical protein